MPEPFVQMMDTWKKHLSDYEFKLWDRKSLDEINIMFANEAVSVRKWAFAADVIRIYAVYHYGGIWLDGDVTVHQSFDPFLKYRMFIGKEHMERFQTDGSFCYVNLLTAHCFGAEKGHPFMKDCLDYYEGRHFVVSNKETLPQGLRYDMRLLPEIQSLLAAKYGYKGIFALREEEEVLDDDIHVFPPYKFDHPDYHKMEEVFSVHHRAGTWVPGNDEKNKIFLFPTARKKDIFYYICVLANKLLAKKELRIKVMSR